VNREQCVIMLILMRQEWQVAIAVADDIWTIKGDCWPERIAQSTGMHELRYCFVIIIIIIQFIKRLRRGFRGTGGRPIVGVNQKTTWSMVIVGRMREKIIKTVLLCTHWCAYTYEQFLQITVLCLASFLTTASFFVLHLFLLSIFFDSVELSLLVQLTAWRTHLWVWH